MDDAEHRLTARIRAVASRSWIDGYFDLVADVLEATRLTDDDPRLALTIPRQSGLQVNINQRYVLAFGARRGQIRFIVERDWLNGTDARARAVGIEIFRPRAGERVEETPYLVTFQGDAHAEHVEGLRWTWLAASLREVHRGRRSSFRRLHEPVFYAAATDRAYREQLLRAAFRD